MQSDFALNKYLHTVASCWILLIQSYDVRNHEYKSLQECSELLLSCQITSPLFCPVVEQSVFLISVTQSYTFTCTLFLLHEPLSGKITYSRTFCSDELDCDLGVHSGFMSCPDSKKLIIFWKVLLKFCRFPHAVRMPQTNCTLNYCVYAPRHVWNRNEQTICKLLTAPRTFVWRHCRELRQRWAALTDKIPLALARESKMVSRLVTSFGETRYQVIQVGVARMVSITKTELILKPDCTERQPETTLI